MHQSPEECRLAILKLCLTTHLWRKLSSKNATRFLYTRPPIALFASACTLLSTECKRNVAPQNARFLIFLDPFLSSGVAKSSSPGSLLLCAALTGLRDRRIWLCFTISGCCRRAFFFMANRRLHAWLVVRTSGLQRPCMTCSQKNFFKRPDSLM